MACGRFNAIAVSRLSLCCYIMKCRYWSRQCESSINTKMVIIDRTITCFTLKYGTRTSLSICLQMHEHLTVLGHRQAQWWVHSYAFFPPGFACKYVLRFVARWRHSKWPTRSWETWETSRHFKREPSNDIYCQKAIMLEFHVFIFADTISLDSRGQHVHGQRVSKYSIIDVYMCMHVYVYIHLGWYLHDCSILMCICVEMLE